MPTILQFPPMVKSTKGNAPNRIRELRKAQKLTLQGLADRLDNSLSLNQLSRLELGTSQLTHQWLTRIAAALGAMPADLLHSDAGGLTPRERELIDTFRDIPESHRASFDALREAHQQFRGAPEVIDLERKRG